MYLAKYKNCWFTAMFCFVIRFIFCLRDFIYGGPEVNSIWWWLIARWLTVQALKRGVMAPGRECRALANASIPVWCICYVKENTGLDIMQHHHHHRHYYFDLCDFELTELIWTQGWSQRPWKRSNSLCLPLLASLWTTSPFNLGLGFWFFGPTFLFLSV